MFETRRTAIMAGAIVTGVLAVFLILLSFAADWQRRSRGFALLIKFSNLNNLSVGAPVRLNGGLQIGEVESIYQKNLQTYVRVYLNREFENRIPAVHETQFAIFSTALAGAKYMNLFMPAVKPGDRLLREGDEWWGINPPSFDLMLLSFSSWFGGRSGEEIFTSIIRDADFLLHGIRDVQKENQEDLKLTVETARNAFRKLSDNMEILSGRFRKLKTDLAEKDSRNSRAMTRIIDDINRVSLNMESLAEKLKNNRGSLKKLMNSDELYSNSLATARYAKKFVECIKNQPYVLVSREPCP